MRRQAISGSYASSDEKPLTSITNLAANESWLDHTMCTEDRDDTVKKRKCEKGKVKRAGLTSGSFLGKLHSLHDLVLAGLDRALHCHIVLSPANMDTQL